MNLNLDRVRRDVIVIGASAGGLAASVRLLGAIPMDLDAVLALVIHRSAHWTSVLRNVLEQKTGRHFVEPVPGYDVEARAGVVFLAPRDLHLVVTASHFRAVRGPMQHFTRPAVDALFRSAALAFEERVVGVLLSGTGDDGVLGLVAIKEHGGLSVVQDPDDAEYAEMVENALRADSVDAALALPELGRLLTALARGRATDVKAPSA